MEFFLKIILNVILILGTIYINYIEAKDPKINNQGSNMLLYFNTMFVMYLIMLFFSLMIIYIP